MTNLTVLLNEDFEDILDLIAKVEDRTKNSLINEAIGEYLKNKIDDPEFQEKLMPLMDAMQNFLAAVTMANVMRDERVSKDADKPVYRTRRVTDAGTEFTPTTRRPSKRKPD